MWARCCTGPMVVCMVVVVQEWMYDSYCIGVYNSGCMIAIVYRCTMMGVWCIVHQHHMTASV